MENAISQQSELAHLETVIEKNLQSFVQVGMALQKIRDSKLYLCTNTTFEEYCKERWQFSRRRAYQFIESVTVIGNVNNCSQQPTTESQTRPLAHLEPTQQKEAWEKAVETAPEGKVTAKHVENTVRQIKTPLPKLGPPSNGMQFASMAIMDLEKIADNDIQYDEALESVKEWILTHERRS